MSGKIKVDVESEYSHGRNNANGEIDMRNEMNHDLQLVSFCQPQKSTKEHSMEGRRRREKVERATHIL